MRHLSDSTERWGLNRANREDWNIQSPRDLQGGKRTWRLRAVTHSCSVAANSTWPHRLQQIRLPVLHHLPELAQTHVHWIGDAIHPLILSSPSPSAFSLSKRQGLFNESALRIRWPKIWSFNFSITPFSEYSGLISFRTDWFDPLAVQGTLTPQFEGINSSALRLLYCPTLASIHDYWKNHSFD